MCRIRHVLHSCGHAKVDVYDFCWDYQNQPLQLRIPYKCPKPEIVVEERVLVNKTQAAIVSAVDQAIKSINNYRLPVDLKLPFGVGLKFEVKLPASRQLCPKGCPICHQANVIPATILCMKTARVEKLWGFVARAEKETDSENEERQKMAEAAKRVLKMQAAKTKDDTSLFDDPFMPIECMAVTWLGLSVEGRAFVETAQAEAGAQKDFGSPG